MSRNLQITPNRPSPVQPQGPGPTPQPTRINENPNPVPTPDPTPAPITALNPNGEAEPENQGQFNDLLQGLYNLFGGKDGGPQTSQWHNYAGPPRFQGMFWPQQGLHFSDRFPGFHSSGMTMKDYTAKENKPLNDFRKLLEGMLPTEDGK